MDVALDNVEVNGYRFSTISIDFFIGPSLIIPPNFMLKMVGFHLVCFLVLSFATKPSFYLVSFKSV
jgi:hypothetical protein